MPLLFAATLFVSAFLLFLVQPMIAQMILPRLGGTPAVWNTCMVFFQAALLAGYAYTHSATTYMPVKRQTLMQGGLLVLPFLFFLLPFSIGNWMPATEVNPIWSVLFILLITVGLPFFVVATSAPLLQRWFGSTGHPSSKDPYFLYGASNLGSMLALISYPFFFQPNFELPGGDQPGINMAQLWMVIYGLLIVLVGCCAVAVWFSPPTPLLASAGNAPQPAPLPLAKPQQHITRRLVRQRMKAGTATAATATATAPVSAHMAAAAKPLSEHITNWRRLRWIALTAVPSSLMLGLTTYLTTDIAAIPLFWIVPLALYLLSFILVFARWPVVWTGTPHRLFLYFQPVAVLTLGLVHYATHKADWGISTFWLIVVHLTAFFACVMVCHGELAKDRPSLQHLTEFYLWMSVGGVVGGLFNSLVAPLVFNSLIEYGLVLLVVFFLRPQTHFLEWIRRQKEPADDHSIQEYLLDVGYAAVLGLLAFALLRLVSASFWEPPTDDFREWYVVYGNGLRKPADVEPDVWRMQLRNHFPSVFNPNANIAHLLPQRFKAGLWKFYKARGIDYNNAVMWARWTELLVIFGIPVLICLCFAGRPVRLGLGFLALFIVGTVLDPNEILDPYSVEVHKNRSFFSVQTVRQDTNDYGTYNVLVHGTIDHGRQNLNPTEEAQRIMANFGIEYFDPSNKRDQPISYFYPINPIGKIFMELRKMPSKPPFAVVGLGTGTLASYARKGQELHFYEIDPAVVQLSLPPEGGTPYFFYLLDARKRGVVLPDVKLGDGRLRMQEAPENFYQIIVIDAFSSDAIPVHLLTKEAVNMYLAKLKPDGVLIFNITNKYVNLAPVLADVARECDLVCLEQGDANSRQIPDKFGTDWVILYRKPKDVKTLALNAAQVCGSLGSGSSVLGKLQPGMVLLTDPWRLGEPVKECPDYPTPFPFTTWLDLSNWARPEPTGRPAWTDHYQDLIRAMNW